MPSSSSSACPPTPPRKALAKTRLLPVSFRGTGRRCTTRVPLPSGVSSQIHWAPLDVVSHETVRPGSTVGDHVAGRPQDALALVDAEVPLARPQPALLQRDHPDQLGRQLGHPAYVAEHLPHHLGRRVDRGLGPQLAFGGGVGGGFHGTQSGSRGPRSATLCPCSPRAFAPAGGPRAAAGLLLAVAPSALAAEPDTIITSGPENGAFVLPGPVSFTFVSDVGPNVTFQCKVDNGAFASCTSPATYDLAPGGHVFTVRALDAVQAPTRHRRPGSGPCATSPASRPAPPTRTPRPSSSSSSRSWPRPGSSCTAPRARHRGAVAARQEQGAPHQGEDLQAQAGDERGDRARGSRLLST